MVETWGSRAVPDSVGYRLVRTFRTELITAVYDAYMAALSALEPPTKNKRQPRRAPTSQADEPVWRLLSERPAPLVPPGYRDWDAVIEAALSRTLSAIGTEADGKIDAFTWGSANRAGIKHPLGEALPGLGLLLDPPNEPQPGDAYQPRVARPGFGASDRFVVAPGQEKTGVFQMPTGQSGHPLSPYYNLAHEAWTKGQPTPFLPGQPRWQLRFQPG
jgi:penicillin G amidase